MKKIQKGNNISVHYVGTLDDGTKFDSSHDRGETLDFEVGSGQMIKGFDDAVTGMLPGEKKTVSLSPQDAYGEINPAAVQEVSLNAFPPDTDLQEGLTVFGENQDGNKIVAKVISLSEENVTLDFNHPLAGKNLNFEIEIVTVD